VRPVSSRTPLWLLGAFLAGLFTHLLYQRWTAPFPGGQAYPVALAPWERPISQKGEAPLLEAREVEKIRKLAGGRARVRGRVYRVGHSSKSDTYFLNFGPSPSSFTGVIFSSSLALFEKKGSHPKSYEGREVELAGEIKDHPKYGLEMILEDPAQVKIVD